MLVGKQYAENKLFRGIQYYDQLPLMSEDQHEYADTVHMKSAYILNNILGSGILNSLSASASDEGISLQEPAILLVDGDIALAQSDEGSALVSKSRIASAGISSGTVCIVGWYQHLYAISTMRNYGGVENSEIENTLAKNKFSVQISTRHQFRWTTALVNRINLSADSISMTIEGRDANGNATGNTLNITSTSKSGNVYIAPKPSAMDYAESDLYIIPLLNYDYSSSSDSITSINSVPPVSNKEGSGFIKSDTEPEGEYPEGTHWYDPINKEFKIYVQGLGFINITSKMGFIQYQAVHSFPNNITTPQDVTVPIDISELEEGDIIQVIYEGLTLVSGEHYEIDYVNHVATLLGFTINAGDQVTFTATKIVEADDVTRNTDTFVHHMATKGSDTIEAHVKLSDSTDSDLGVQDGVAATPRAVRESQLIKDSTTNSNYRFGVENGLLYIEEV